MNKYVVFFLMAFMATYVGAVTKTGIYTIQNMTIGPDYARVSLDKMSEAENCTSSQFYYLDLSKKEMFSALLAAKLSKQPLYLQLIGCKNNHPEITHIYICEEKNCPYTVE